jgi:hypothetical protein
MEEISVNSTVRIALDHLWGGVSSGAAGEDPGRAHLEFLTTQRRLLECSSGEKVGLLSGRYSGTRPPFLYRTPHALHRVDGPFGPSRHFGVSVVPQCEHRRCASAAAVAGDRLDAAARLLGRTSTDGGFGSIVFIAGTFLFGSQWRSSSFSSANPTRHCGFFLAPQCWHH